MRPMKSFCEIGVVFIVMLGLASPVYSSGKAVLLAKGKVKLVGRYTTKKVKEGNRPKTYFNLQKSRKMRLKSGGPVNLVLLLRGLRAEKLNCELYLDGNDKRSTTMKVSNRASRGIYVKIPIGQHRLSLQCDRNVWFRPLKSKKGPQAGQEVIAWSGHSDKNRNLELVPLVPPQATKKSTETFVSSKDTNTDIPPPVDKAPVAAPVDSGASERVAISSKQVPKVEKKAEQQAPGSRPLAPVANMKQLCDQLASRVKADGPVVVAPFKLHSSSRELDSLKTGVSSYLNTCLKRDHSLALVEQQQRSDVFKEVELSMTGMVDAKKAAELGQTMGAKVMVVGSISKLGSLVAINVRAISIENLRVVFSQMLKVPYDSLASVLKVQAPSELASRKRKQAETRTLGNIDGKPVEVRLRMLADRLADGFSRLPGNGRYERLVVAELKESGEATKDLELGVLVSAQLSTFLQRDHNFFILERSRIQDALKEIQLGMTGLLDPDKAAQAGKMIGAQAIVVGSISEAGADFLVNVRLISVETAEVLVAESISLPRAGMVALSDESVVLRTRSGSIFRSVVVPGWGQFYNRQPVKGGVIIGLELALAGAAVATHFLGASKESEYSASDFALKYPGLDPDQLSQKAQELRSDAESYYGARNILIYSAIGVYLYNILDAYLFGVDGESETNTAVAPTVTANFTANFDRKASPGLALGMSF